MSNIQLHIANASIYSFCYLSDFSSVSMFCQKIPSGYNSTQRFNLTALLYDSSYNDDSAFCVVPVHTSLLSVVVLY